MAIGKKTGGRNFKKGHVANPKGRPPASPELKAARKLTNLEFERICTNFFNMSIAELKQICEDVKHTNVLEGLIGRVLYNGIQKNSQSELNYFIERFLGKVAETHNFNGNLNTGLVDLIQKLNSQGGYINGKGQEEKTVEEIGEEEN